MAYRNLLDGTYAPTSAYRNLLDGPQGPSQGLSKSIGWSPGPSQAYRNLLDGPLGRSQGLSKSIGWSLAPSEGLSKSIGWSLGPNEGPLKYSEWKRKELQHNQNQIDSANQMQVQYLKWVYDNGRCANAIQVLFVHSGFGKFRVAPWSRGEGRTRRPRARGQPYFHLLTYVLTYPYFLPSLLAYLLTYILTHLHTYLLD